MAEDPQFPNPEMIINRWFRSMGWKPFAYQKKVWSAYLSGKSGLVHAPVGIGKTYAAWFGPVLEWMAENTAVCRNSNGIPSAGKEKLKRNIAEPIRVLWLTPFKALAVDLGQAMEKTLLGLNMPWIVETRTGDTSSSLRTKQGKKLPTCLITTPESLSLLLSYKDAAKRFSSLSCAVVDEWHELLGSKRGVMVELALSRLKTLRPGLRVWGLSATLGDTDSAIRALLGDRADHGLVIKGPERKKIRIESVLPKTMDRFPWAGHLGLKMLPQAIERIERSESILVFANTRSQAETWYRAILDAKPEWIDKMALHHGSLDRNARLDVESRLRQGLLKCVVCTSSLELGVDFSPVDRVMQIGSPKGIARLAQRAGRSGHRPGGVSVIYCVPTNALQLVEISAARKALESGQIETREPVLRPLDLLAQHMATLAAGDGFTADSLLGEIRSTHSYAKIEKTEFDWALDFVARGGKALGAYPQFCKVKAQNGIYTMADDALARRHRMSIGVIVGDADMDVRYLKGGRLGKVEESFASRLKPGDRFIFAGKTLEAVKTRDMVLYVKKTRKAPGAAPRWMGGRMPLSTRLGSAVRARLHDASLGIIDDPEMKALDRILEIQSRWSAVPSSEELLVEHTVTRQGRHLFLYPFEGRLAHEGLGALFAMRISRAAPIAISIAVNDYGIELFSDRDIPVPESLKEEMFSLRNLDSDIVESLNLSEMARSRFREIARVAGLVFQGYPGKGKTNRQLQASSGLLYNVLRKYDPENLLIEQAEREVMSKQLEMERLVDCLARIRKGRLKVVRTPHPTPLAFPLMVDRLRTAMGPEKLFERILKMQASLEKAASVKGKGNKAGKKPGKPILELLDES